MRVSRGGRVTASPFQWLIWMTNKAPLAFCSNSPIVTPAARLRSAAITTSMSRPRSRSIISKSRMRSDPRMNRAVSGNSTSSAIRSAPM